MPIKRFLTIRERQIFELLIQNNDTEEIATKLNISSKTVRNHISNVIQKLGVKGRSQAILELIKMHEIIMHFYYLLSCHALHIPYKIEFLHCSLNP